MPDEAVPHGAWLPFYALGEEGDLARESVQRCEGAVWLASPPRSFHANPTDNKRRELMAKTMVDREREMTNLLVKVGGDPARLKKRPGYGEIVNSSVQANQSAPRLRP